MAPQLDYSASMTEGFAGLIATAEVKNGKSGAAEEELNFGYGVVQGTADVQVKLPTADTDTFLGVTIHEHRTDGKYPINSNLTYLTKGVIWVPVTVAVAKHAKAYVIASGVDAGKFTNISTSNIDSGGFFTKAVGAAGITTVELNNPQV